MSYLFSVDFQKNILASLIRDEDFLKESSETLQPEHFGDEILSGVAQCALDFWKAHKEAPSLEALLKEIKAHVAPGRKFHEYSDTVRDLYKNVPENPEYYQDNAREFARSQAMQQALALSAPLLEQGDLTEIHRIVKEASDFGRVNGDKPYDFFGSAAERLKGYLNGHDKTDERLGTGLPMLDGAMNGGLGRGELGVVVALPGYGKTTTLVNLGARAVLQNKRVAYFTLELSKKMIAGKFDNNLFGMTLEKIKSAPKSFATALKDLRNKLTGGLYIYEFPTDALTIDKLQTMADKIGNLDLILVDYGQLIKPPTKREHTRNELTEVYKGLRRVAGELKVPMWTAHQANRPGTHSKVIQMEHIAEDFNVAATADICVSINHSEEEHRQGKMRMFVMKSRIGPSGVQFECAINWKTCRVTV